MLDAEKVVMAKAMSGEKDDGVVSAYLAIAGSKICRRAYPFDQTAAKVPDRYAMTQVEIAVYLLSRRGSEGQLSHSENGYSDSYESGYIPSELLREVMPMAAVL